MAPLDAKVAATLDSHEADLSDEDELISALEDEDDSTLSHLREQRLNQLHAEFSRAKILQEASHGTYQTLKDEKAVLDITTNTKLVVVHFRKSDFAKCLVMDEKLGALAPRHFDTRFVAINVDDAPFLVAKMDIRVLPCVFAFVNGIKTDRILGFEGLGVRPDKFTLRELEARLLFAGVLTRPKVANEERAASSRAEQTSNDDNDDDWD